MDKNSGFHTSVCKASPYTDVCGCTARYTIEIITVGSCFATEGMIRKNGSEIVYKTRLYSFGADGAARRDCVSEAARRGMCIAEGV